MSTTTTTTGDYEPEWFHKLERQEPKAADDLKSDPLRIKKIDMLLDGIKDTDHKLEVLRLAYNAGMSPDDEFFLFTIHALKIQSIFGRNVTGTLDELERTGRRTIAMLSEAKEELDEATKSSADHIKTYTLEATRRIADITTAVSDEIRANTRAATDEMIVTRNQIVEEVGNLQISIVEAQQRLSVIPQAVEAILDTAHAYARERVEIEAKDIAQETIAREVQQKTATLSAALDTANTRLTDINTAMEPVAIAAQHLVHDDLLVFGAFQLHRATVRFTSRVLLIGSTIALLFGILIGNLTVNAGIGQSARIQEAIQVSDSYNRVYNAFSNTCRAEINAILKRR